MDSELAQNVSTTIAGKINASDILKAIPGIDILVMILQAVGVLFIIYLLFMIIRAITGINTSRRLKRVAEGVEDINKKLDILVKRKK